MTKPAAGRALWLALALALAACAPPSYAEARLFGADFELRVSTDGQRLYLTAWLTRRTDKYVQFDSDSLVFSLAQGVRVLRSEVFYSPYASPPGKT